MAKRVILYEETYDSNTQFNPVTDIESVFHGSNQLGDNSQPVGHSIFTNNQESLSTLLSRINSWLYKLKALNDYEVALTTDAAGNKDLALQTKVNQQMSDVRDEIRAVQNKADVNTTKANILEGRIQTYADFVNMLLLPNFPSSNDEIIWSNTLQVGVSGATDTYKLNIDNYRGDEDFKNHYIKIEIRTPKNDKIATFILRGDVDDGDARMVDIDLVTLNYDEYEKYINQYNSYENEHNLICFQLKNSGVRALVSHFRKTV